MCVQIHVFTKHVRSLPLCQACAQPRGEHGTASGAQRLLLVSIERLSPALPAERLRVCQPRCPHPEPKVPKVTKQRASQLQFSFRSPRENATRVTYAQSSPSETGKTLSLRGDVEGCGLLRRVGLWKGAPAGHGRLLVGAGGSFLFLEPVLLL